MDATIGFLYTFFIELLKPNKTHNNYKKKLGKIMSKQDCIRTLLLSNQLLECDSNPIVD